MSVAFILFLQIIDYTAKSRPIPPDAQEFQALAHIIASERLAL